MLLVIEIAAGIVLAVAVLAWRREIGALALAAVAFAVVVGSASSMSWQENALVGAVAVMAWVWRRRLRDWAGLGEDLPLEIADGPAIPDTHPIQPATFVAPPDRLRDLRRP